MKIVKQLNEWLTKRIMDEVKTLRFNSDINLKTYGREKEIKYRYFSSDMVVELKDIYTILGNNILDLKKENIELKKIIVQDKPELIFDLLPDEGVSTMTMVFQKLGFDFITRQGEKINFKDNFVYFPDGMSISKDDYKITVTNLTIRELKQSLLKQIGEKGFNEFIRTKKTKK